MFTFVSILKLGNYNQTLSRSTAMAKSKTKANGSSRGSNNTKADKPAEEEIVKPVKDEKPRYFSLVYS